jgi:DNA polymerase I-like protein with 3'-5' exonuclease and polymerase domains
MSNPKFAELLTQLGATVPMKISPTTGKETFAFAKTDLGLLDLMDHPNPAVVAVTEVRLGVKSTIEETRTQRLIDVSKRGPLPIMLKYYAAHTGRFGGGDKLNMQNLPARGNNVIRSAICAPQGYKVVACDSSQIEARMLAYIAGQADLVQAFREGRDVYSEFATKVFGYAVTKANKMERFVGKTCILGLGYGMGHVKFRDTLKKQGGIEIDEAEAKRIVYLYRNTYPMIPQLWTRCDSLLRDMTTSQGGVVGNIISYDQHGIVLPNKMVLRYNALRSTDDGFSYIGDARAFRKFAARVVMGASKDDISWTNIYGGKVTENIIQALARIVIADQMTAIGQSYRVILQVHDENVVCVPDALVADAQQVLVQAMTTPPVWAPDLPIACDDGAVAAQNYGGCK